MEATNLYKYYLSTLMINLQVARRHWVGFHKLKVENCFKIVGSFNYKFGAFPLLGGGLGWGLIYSLFMSTISIEWERCHISDREGRVGLTNKRT